MVLSKQSFREGPLHTRPRLLSPLPALSCPEQHILPSILRLLPPLLESASPHASPRKKSLMSSLASSAVTCPSFTSIPSFHSPTHLKSRWRILLSISFMPGLPTEINKDLHYFPVEVPQPLLGPAFLCPLALNLRTHLEDCISSPPPPRSPPPPPLPHPIPGLERKSRSQLWALSLQEQLCFLFPLTGLPAEPGIGEMCS